MSEENSIVLKMILSNDNGLGNIECEIDDWQGICYKITRKRIKNSDLEKYKNKPCVYILFGKENEIGKAYIGETENIYQRLQQHDSKKDFWNECIVFISKGDILNKGHIKYIEYNLYKIAKETNRFELDNDTIPTESTLGHSDKIIANNFIKKIKLLTSVLNYKIFNKLNEDKNDENILYLKNHNELLATGKMTDEGFVILKGSKLKKEISKGLSPSLINYCNRERNSIDIKNYEYIKDHLVSSPSMAGVIILGRNFNGQREWKNKKGISLKDISNKKK